MALATRPKPTRHHQKRNGQHHKQNKHYVKAYWPYLPMLMMVVIGLAISSLWSAKSAVLGASSDFSAQTLLLNTNSQREHQQEADLTLDTQLTAAAQAKAADMAAHNYWSHNSPQGKTPWTFIDASGYAYQQAGENLAYGFTDAGSTITGWMNSPEHRANMLNAGYSQVGFGVAHSQNYQGAGPTTIIVAMYGQPISAVANIHFTVPNQSGDVTAKTLGSTNRAQPPSQLVSRVQLLTGGQAPWSMFAVSLLASSALLVFLMRHGLRLRRLVTQGEVYVMHHPAFDLAIVFIATAGFVLTRAGGVIR
ncbi:MAG: hypothetical protein JWO41_577 [Candidatus Saccharibacteria bacterium]|nr:hypothetical protein [Candidatus Saccharibacteria bacterium]